MYSKIKNPLNNQVYPVYSFQGKKLLKQYVKQLSGGEDIFNVPLSTRAKLVQRNRERRRQQPPQLHPQPQPQLSIQQQDNSRINDFDRLDQESQRFIDTVNVRSNSSISPSLINLKGVRSDLNKLKEWSNYIPEGFKEEEQDLQSKFRLVEGYLEREHNRKIDDSETILLMEEIDNKIKRQRNLKFVPFKLFKKRFEKWIIRKKREKRRQLEIQKQTNRRTEQKKFVRHRYPNQPPK